MPNSSSSTPRFNVSALLRAHRQTHDLSYWLRHEYTVTIKRDGVTYCVCESCHAEINELLDQWTRDEDSRIESLRMARETFLGFDPDAEWQRRTT